ncbi:MAG TPA: 2-oxo acid dehydrogenase subunit E2 [Polyangiaceae bacterium]|nr:2-oxo acid dehydrogenase subunit E2 [Polyangiaceae bacterium]
MSDPHQLSGWRRVAGLIWDAPSDPQIYGSLEIDASALLAFMQRVNATGAHLTPTHLVGRAVGHALAEVPPLNVRLVGGRAIPRESIDVFFITATRGGADLSGVKVSGIDTKSARAVAGELAAESQRLREGEDPALARAKRRLAALPRPLARAALRVAAWAAGDRGWRIPALGIAPSPFGSAMVSSVGMFGLPLGFAPIAWMYRVPLLVLVAEITERAVSIAGRVESRPMLPMSVTVDHRYIDAAGLGQALAALQNYLRCPSNYESEPNG